MKPVRKLLIGQGATPRVLIADGFRSGDIATRFARQVKKFMGALSASPTRFSGIKTKAAEACAKLASPCWGAFSISNI